MFTQTAAPILQQAMAMLQQLRAQQPTDPNVQALVKTQLAETERKAAYDQADLQLRGQKQVSDTQEKQDKLKVQLVTNTEDNLTQERIKSAELTNDAARLQSEQLQTAIEAQNQLQSNLGVQP